ncbi:2OG-Fe(II) oxygenase [Marinobacter fonticola]|uniref:2OG-Fe(II) oxygenase n=1 Tax=Marinobacter fonticola TaxID=2603215 RepID=UPI001D0D95C1|nr:2OG-Fe(II) oxygenase [Marinobacter fonticola]
MPAIPIETPIVLPFDDSAARSLPVIDQATVLDQWLDTVSDELAEFGWTQHSIEPLVSPGLLENLHQEVTTLHRTEAMKSAGVGRGADHVQDRSVRRDHIAWLHGETLAQQSLFVLFERIQVGLNQRLFLGLKRFEAHYATYEPGDFYRCHLDSFRGRSSRIVSLVLYLNEGWRLTDGGLLQVFNRDNPNEVCGSVLPEAGRVVLFVSEEVPHEVLPAQRTRHSIACWFRRDPIQGIAV